MNSYCETDLINFNNFFAPVWHCSHMVVIDKGSLIVFC